jgi:hypothetical protein
MTAAIVIDSLEDLRCTGVTFATIRTSVILVIVLAEAQTLALAISLDPVGERFPIISSLFHNLTFPRPKYTNFRVKTRHEGSHELH